MGLRHRAYPIYGVQFHPESIMTVVGKDLLRAFLAVGQPVAPISRRRSAMKGDAHDRVPLRA